VLAAAALASRAQAQLSDAMVGGLMGFGVMSLSGWEGEERGKEDVTTSAVVAAHVANLLEWRCRAMAARRVQRPRYRGCTPGRACNGPLNFELGVHSILRDCCRVDVLPPVHGMREFERRFRVPMPVFLRIYHKIKDRPFGVQSLNATGRPQAHPLQKLVSPFRVLGYAESRDRADEYARLSSSTISRVVTLFTESMVDEIIPRYLRPPTPAVDEAARLPPPSLSQIERRRSKRRPAAAALAVVAGRPPWWGYSTAAAAPLGFGRRPPPAASQIELRGACS